MNIGYFGNSPLAAAAARRLIEEHRVIVFGPVGNRALEESGAAVAENLAHLARSCDVIFIGLGSQAEVREALFASDGLAQALSAGKIVIDQTPGDPDQTRTIADELRKRDVVLLDAPIHYERVDATPDTAAIMCGGPVDTVESVRPLLESICPKVVYCGDTGNGQATRLVVAAVAACNRLVTYECAAVGVQNGLAIEHMATVLNRSSGYNSASARILPVLATGGRIADVSLGAVVEDLKMASRLAMRCGAPMLVANLASCIIEGAATELGASSSLDEIARIFEAAAGIDFEDAKTWATDKA